MRKVRVLIANQPRLMRELVVDTISGQSDLEVIGVLDDEASILSEVEQSRPDFLIITLGRSEERPAMCNTVLEHFPHMRILALASECDSAIFYWAKIDIWSRRIENSEESILCALRGTLVAPTVHETGRDPRVN